MMTREITGWIWESHARTTVEYLARWVGYDFDDFDWGDIETGIAESTWEPPERWYDYSIEGDLELAVSFARDENDRLIGIKVTGEMDAILEARIDTLLTLLADRRLA